MILRIQDEKKKGIQDEEKKYFNNSIITLIFIVNNFGICAC